MLSSAEGKNHNVLLMMMAVTFAATTASQITKEPVKKDRFRWNLSFFTGFFEEVGPFFGQDGTSDRTNTRSIFYNSGSNETMQNALASITGCTKL